MQGVTMRKQAIGYVRVSTQGQVKEGVSLDAQRAKIAVWCDLNDYDLLTVFADEGLSGASMHKRDGLNAALKLATTGTALVCYSMSRLARSTHDMIGISARLDKQGADLVSLTEKIDTTTAAGRMVFRLLASFAEFERDQTSERTKLALAHKRAQGLVYARVPFGFTEVEGRLVRVKAEARILATILRDREAGRPYGQIADALNRDGVKGKRGGRWYASTIRQMVKRPAVGVHA
jgi:site-specific DNA recombinase